MAWRPLQVCLSTTTGCFDSSVLMQEEVTTACPLRLVCHHHSFYFIRTSHPERTVLEKENGGGEEKHFLQ
ncbi:POC1 centriolar protein [Trichinella spiralis]|uniref:POC1 centriolar protein n=1 Tax=Trichinella spiralis TaxID=6334 RepID=A0ABR3KH57_TRISP